jgi:hypothetical protein
VLWFALHPCDSWLNLLPAMRPGKHAGRVFIPVTAAVRGARPTTTGGRRTGRTESAVDATDRARRASVRAASGGERFLRAARRERNNQ